MLYMEVVYHHYMYDCKSQIKLVKQEFNKCLQIFMQIILISLTLSYRKAFFKISRNRLKNKSRDVVECAKMPSQYVFCYTSPCL